MQQKDKEKKNSHSKIILGVDPGTKITGYGVIQTDVQHSRPLDYGCIRPPANLKLSDRHLIIFKGILELIDLYLPDILVVETQYVYKNVRSALTLGMTRGIIIIAAKKRGIPVFQYSPTKAKKAVVGTGSASKFQVQAMIQSLLNLAVPPEPEDAADALALAICHAHTPEHLLHTFEI